MTRLLALPFAFALCAIGLDAAETRTLGLREAIRLAITQNPEVQMARLEIEKSRSDLALVRTERSTSVYAGSGLGATSGIPQSIQGAAPSVAQLTLRQPLIDIERPRRTESLRQRMLSGEHAADAVSEQLAYRVGIVYLDYEFAVREVDRLASELEHFESIERVAADRVKEGAEIPLALSRARLDKARARERQAAAETRAQVLEAELRRLLGLSRDTGILPESLSDESDIGFGDTASATASRPIDEHPAMASLAADIRSARHRAREARSARLPKLDIVGQYSLLARFNNYDDFFRRFQRHNWQAGVALAVPIFTGRSVAERVARARLEERELALLRNAKRADLELEGQRARSAVRDAERIAELATQELAYARENLDVLLAQFEEGRIHLAELERARVLESTAWGGLIASRYELAKAKLGMVYSEGGIHDVFGD